MLKRYRIQVTGTRAEKFQAAAAYFWETRTLKSPADNNEVRLKRPVYQRVGGRSKGGALETDFEVSCCTCWASLVLKASRSNSTAAEGSTNLRVEPNMRANRQRSSCMNAMFLLSCWHKLSQRSPPSHSHLLSRHWDSPIMCRWEWFTHCMAFTLLQHSLRQVIVENQPPEHGQVEQRLWKHWQHQKH